MTPTAPPRELTVAHTARSWDTGPGGTLHVRTWPAGVRRLFAMRSFSVADDGGRGIGSAVSAWLVLDMEKRPPAAVGPLLEAFGLSFDDMEPPAVPEKLPAAGTPETEHRFAVRYGDIDMNRHVTSASYLSWALECVPPGVRDSHFPAGVELSFLAEAFHGDEVLSAAAREPAGDGQSDLTWRHSVACAADGRECARLRTRWRPR